MASLQDRLRQMPPGLKALPQLAGNLRWTWSHAADRLWQAIAPDIWAATRNPWLILQAVPQARLEQCAGEAAILEQIAQLAATRAQYMTQPTWCGERGLPRTPLTAYFCLEFGIAEALPLYSGGLGILAGDMLKTASDLGVPMVGVGLLYSEGYFRQSLDADGNQRELYPPNAAEFLPIAQATGQTNTPLAISLALPGRELTIRVWQVQVGRVPLLLLDCNDPRNSAADRGITARLYPAELETRFLQQMVLGIGGWRALTELGCSPDVCHFNEGHSALAAFERSCALARSFKIGFEDALWACRPGNIFTTHTPVAAAFDAFPRELTLRYMRPLLADAGVGEQEFLALGRGGESHAADLFIPALLAMRACGRINAVSRVHGEVSRRLFLTLFPRRPVHEVPVGHITNGIHVPSWDSAWADELWTQACGKRRWQGALEEISSAIEALDDRTLWDLRNNERRDLVGYARQRLSRQIGQRGQDTRAQKAAAQALDPNALTLGFARRFTDYKRPNLLLRDAQRLERLLTDASRPVQLIIAGKAHPQDAAGKAMIKEWVHFAQQPAMRARVIFLEDYDIELAEQLVQGIDVWINTPRRPWEACGTSGMKVLVNGGLNVSELDGWWADAYAPDVGWGVVDGPVDSSPTQDAQEAETLYRLLEKEVIPTFYERGPDGIAHRWVAMVRASMARLAPGFSSNRMLREYFETAYCPAAVAFAQRSADGAALAKELRTWAEMLRTHWSQVRLSNLECRSASGTLLFSVHVYLGEIPEGSVAVELYANPSPGEEGAASVRMQRGGPIGGMNAHFYTAEVVSTRPASDFTPRAVPCHPEASLPLELNLITWFDRRG